MHSAVDPSGLKLLAEYDTPGVGAGQGAGLGLRARSPSSRARSTGWSPPTTAPGAARSPRSRPPATPVPPVAGNDAELAAAQRIVSGDQYNTISKPIKIVAERGRRGRVRVRAGQDAGGEDHAVRHPSQLFVPTVVTQENLKEALIDSGELKASEVCTGAYAKGCAKLGIK